MGYLIDFVGLINFFDDGQPGKLVLIPDGTNPPDGIKQHYLNIFVMNAQVHDASEWPAEADRDVSHINVLKFPVRTKSIIEINGQNNGGKLNTDEQDGLLPLLRDKDPNIDIQPPLATTIAQLRLTNGTLRAFRLGRETAVSQLTTRLNDLLTITATPVDGSPAKKLVLRDGAEIVISNTSEIRRSAPPDEKSHFRIYGKLDVSGDDVHLDGEPENFDATTLDQIPSAHPYVVFLRDSGVTAPLPGCSVTGCCACCES